jgi:hypothetical protein
MNRIMVSYFDDKGNEVSEEEARKINIVEFDDNGNRIKETYLISTDKDADELEEMPETPELSETPEIDPSVIANVEWNIPRDPVQELLDKQKTK